MGNDLLLSCSLITRTSPFQQERRYTVKRRTTKLVSFSKQSHSRVNEWINSQQ